MTAGSIFSFLAITGSTPPINWDSSTVQTSVTQTTRATPKPTRSSSISFAKLHTANVPPHSSAARHSRQRIRGRSLGRMSPVAMPQIMVEVL